MPDQTGYANMANEVLPPLVGSGAVQTYLLVANSTTPDQVVAVWCSVPWQFSISASGPYATVGAGVYWPVRLTQKQLLLWMVVPAGYTLYVAVNEFLAVQGPAGPAGPPGASSSGGVVLPTAQNNAGRMLNGGEPLAQTPAGGVVLTDATSIGRRCIGFAASAAAPLAPVSVQAYGPLTLDDWTEVAGTQTLVTGSTYFLDGVVAGRITTSAPTTVGVMVQPVGEAINANTLMVALSQPVLL